jgi:predicted GIY-YIG superfamily endonuclease
MCIIYLLSLEDGKYYVGKTENVEQRYLSHISGNGDGSAWTKLYKPLSIKILSRKANGFDEDKYVKEYMARYGIDNVRGGSYCRIQLSPTVQKYLYNEILGATDRCFSCGKPGHFAFNCTDQTIHRMVTDKSLIVKPDRKCSICNKPGHNKRTCPF